MVPEHAYTQGVKDFLGTCRAATSNAPWVGTRQNTTFGISLVSESWSPLPLPARFTPAQT